MYTCFIIRTAETQIDRVCLGALKSVLACMCVCAPTCVCVSVTWEGEELKLTLH